MPSFPSRKLVVLEANLDDMNPEWFEPLMDRLLEAGALDVTLHPVIMKKGRPGVVVSVLTPPARQERLVNLLFQESTTLGVRSHHVDRFELKRETKEVRTPYGVVSVKIARDPSARILNISPEFESCKVLAKKGGVPLKKVYDAALRALNLDRVGR